MPPRLTLLGEMSLTLSVIPRTGDASLLVGAYVQATWGIQPCIF
jgi:hypothetical protein